MKVDRYTKGVLAVIAACLVWICLNGIPSATAQAQGGRFRIAATTGASVFRVDVQSGDIIMFRDVGNDPRSGRGWEPIPITVR